MADGPEFDDPHGRRLLASILRYDHKLASYKIALIRALSDVAFAYPDIPLNAGRVAVPLRMLAEFWLAYYWPFADEENPIYQAPRAFRDDIVRQDIAFRGAIADVRRLWRKTVITVRPSDGFYLVSEMRLVGNRRKMPPELVVAYHAAVERIAAVIGKNPVRYAGPGEWQAFEPPVRYRRVDSLPAVPGTMQDDVCVLVQAGVWRTLVELSLWVEALCVHQWCLFVERVNSSSRRNAGGAMNVGLDRGDVYRLLTDQPESRLPNTWEKNAINVLLEEGLAFTCPWTGRSLSRKDVYDLEHIVPVAIYPLNELWNLVPADGRFNRNVKRDRLPTDELLARAQPALEGTYRAYLNSRDLEPAIRSDSRLRFAQVDPDARDFASQLAGAVSSFVARIRDARGVPTFDRAA